VGGGDEDVLHGGVEALQHGEVERPRALAVHREVRRHLRPPAADADAAAVGHVPRRCGWTRRRGQGGETTWHSGGGLPRVWGLDRRDWRGRGGGGGAQRAASRDEEDEENKKGTFFSFARRVFAGFFFGLGKRGGEKRRSRDAGRNVGALVAASGIT
jgi:hypothetical protein